jgi:hypothetical protein
MQPGLSDSKTCYESLSQVKQSLGLTSGTKDGTKDFVLFVLFGMLPLPPASVRAPLHSHRFLPKCHLRSEQRSHLWCGSLA